MKKKNYTDQTEVQEREGEGINRELWRKQGRKQNP